MARTNIVSRQGEAVTVGSLNPLTFNEAVASVQDGRLRCHMVHGVVHHRVLFLSNLLLCRNLHVQFQTAIADKERLLGGERSDSFVNFVLLCL